MRESHRLLVLSAAMLILASLTCQVQPSTPPAPISTAAPTQLPATPQISTVVPLATQTLAPVAGGSVTVTLTSTITISAPRPATSTPNIPAAKLEFTQDDVTFSLSPKRKGDNKVQLTISLHPKGGREPFSFVVDNIITYQGLATTLDWHNCGPAEPHSIVVISGDGQKSKSVSIMFPYDCQ